ncbi:MULTISPECIES: LppU/SCO3897 family protein [unclassified Micromonospora]|uniref:LppU/SCO3897 family protein n=1 Tax=unclassified Micromonospora TaxID=2617518 RepID=UPI002FF3C3F9
MSEQVAPPPAPQAAQPEPAAQPDATAPAAPAASPVEPAAKGSGGRALAVIGAVGVFLVVAGLKFGLGTAIGTFFNKDETAEAKAGDCIAELPTVTGTEQRSVSGAEVVKCTSTEAVYTVVGRVEDQTEAQAKTGQACEPYIKPDQDGYLFYNIAPGGKGYLLCLTRKA